MSITALPSASRLRQLTTRIDLATAQALERRAREHERTVAAEVRLALRHHLEQEPKP